ncbi:hypothetical protein [Streptomyces sp. NBC_00572]|uniref:hypothetical protein n=1 Tax=Streptomyces sp. NBC_00572 TaxID=2903664 RepID=UPI00225B36E2|nr:hypothetical protein [Streptomyces sp. NBC_00572]MCX4981174.1 hypothetical protein [Streptomyces sp. NBC_00572]
MKKHEEYEKAQAAKAGWVELGATVGSGFRQDMVESVGNGYGLGNDHAKQIGNAPETG